MSQVLDLRAHLHQIHCVLCVPLKKVRREISVGGARLAVTTGIPANQREAFPTQRLQLGSKVAPTASCGTGPWVRARGLRARPCCRPYLPRAPGSSRTAWLPSPARSKCRSTPLTRWRPRELRGGHREPVEFIPFHGFSAGSRVPVLTGTKLGRVCATAAATLPNPTAAESSCFMSDSSATFSTFSFLPPETSWENRSPTTTLLALPQQPVPSFPPLIMAYVGLRVSQTRGR